jgi:hypothetical protein
MSTERLAAVFCMCVPGADAGAGAGKRNYFAMPSGLKMM